MADELDVLLQRVTDDGLQSELRHHIERLRRKRQFGLVFEAHLPERVRLHDHPIRRGLRVVRRDASTDAAPQVVLQVRGESAVLESADDTIEEAPIKNLVVVAEFGEVIYPGFRRLGTIDRGGDKPTHAIIKGENYHTLEALRFSHAAKIDCIYIDPPYNTGARDWKYDNDYVDAEDSYRHSKWLAFMERRLELAKALLNPADSVLIVTIDVHELHRLGLLLERVFSGCRIQMVTSVINPRGRYRDGEFARSDEHLLIVTQGEARAYGDPDDDYPEGEPISWRTFRRSDLESRRGTVKGGTSQFYPIYVNSEKQLIEAIGAPLDHHVPREKAPARNGCIAVFPIRDNGTEMNWGVKADTAKDYLARGYIKLGKPTPTKPQKFKVSYLTSGIVEGIERGSIHVTGHSDSGAVVAYYTEPKLKMPTTNWHRESHNAEVGGTNLLKQLLGAKRFDYPKSLYAVEDIVRYFVAQKPEAKVLDFFGGSATTTHAIMRLNRQDGGRRQSLLITNNEVSEDDAADMRDRGLFPGCEEWEAQGVYEHVAVPRVRAAVTGTGPDGLPIAGHYRFVDEFPIADGFEENVEFLELLYLDIEDVELDFAFEQIAPLLWLRAGGVGPMIGRRGGDGGNCSPYSSTERYGVLFQIDHWRQFIKTLRETVCTAFIVTDSVTAFATIAAELPASIEVVRLYENYLSTFAINGRRQR